MAKIFKKKYYCCGMLHVFTDKQLNQKTLSIIGKFPFMIDQIIRKPTLLGIDYQEITGKDINSVE